MKEIIIFSQSLNNDIDDSLWYAGKYYKGPFTDFNISKILKPLIKARGKRIRKDEETQIYYQKKLPFFYFSLPSNEKDVAGRTSRIEIYCSARQKNKLQDALKQFLAEGHRSIAQKAEAKVLEILKIVLPCRDVGFLKWEGIERPEM